MEVAVNQLSAEELASVEANAAAAAADEKAKAQAEKLEAARIKDQGADHEAGLDDVAKNEAAAARIADGKAG